MSSEGVSKIACIYRKIRGNITFGMVNIVLKT